MWFPRKFFIIAPTRNFFKHRSRFQNYLEGSTLIVCIPVSISTLCSIHLLLLTFLSYMKKNWKSLLPAKRRKRTLSSISTDTIPNSFNDSCHSVYPEKDKLILVLAIPGFLTTLVKNSVIMVTATIQMTWDGCNLTRTFLIHLSIFQP